MAALGIAAPVSMTVGLLAFLIVTAAAVASPLGGLIAAVVALPYFYRPIGIDSFEFAASELLLIAAAAASSMRIVADFSGGKVDTETLLRAARMVFQSRLIQLLAILVVVGALMLVLASEPSARGASLREWRWSLAEPLAMLVLLTLLGQRRSSRALLTAGLIAAGVLAASHALLDIVTEGGVAADNVRRLSGPLPHPNALALFLVRPFVLAAALFALLTRWRMYLILPVTLTGIALFGTFSRGAMFAVLVAALFLAIGMPRRLQIAIGTSTALTVAMAALIAGDRMRNAFEGGSVSLRLDIWTSTMAMIRDSPVTGYGPDQFLYAYTPRYIQPTAWDERFTSHAHNLIADSWVRLGIFGALAALFVLVVVIRRMIAVSRTTRLSTTVDHAALIALGAVLVHGMIDNAIFGHDLAMSAWLLAWLAFPASSALRERRGPID